MGDLKTKLGFTADKLAAIGEIAVNSSVMDSVLGVAIGFLMRAERQSTRIITANMQISEKIGKLRDLSEIVLADEGSKAACKLALDAVSSANGKRNEIIHGIWVHYPAKGHHEVKRYSGPGKMTVERKQVSLKEMQACAAEIERATLGLSAFLQSLQSFSTSAAAAAPSPTSTPSLLDHPPDASPAGRPRP